MRIAALILLLFIVGCGTSTKPPPVNSLSVIIYDTIWKDTTIYRKKIVYDTVHRTFKIYDDTVYKKYKVWVPVPVDSPYTVPVPIDSPYKVGVPIDSPYNVPYPVFVDTTIYNYHYKDSCIEDTITIPPPDTTTLINPAWGLMQAQDNTTETKAILNGSAVNMVRVPIYFSDTKVTSNVADDYLKNGYKVQINLNWKATGTAVEFPTDETIIRSKAVEFFKYYLPYKALIPVVVVENEWDNLTSLHGPGAYHTGTVQQYLKELSIITEIGHKYGFKIASAGITGNNLQRWTYSQLTGAEQAWWKANYFVGLSANYELMIATVNEFAAGIKNIDVDYINTHWYNKTSCPGGYPIATALWLKACGKTKFINNEFGIKTKNLALFTATIAEMKLAGAEIAIIYSGVDAPDNAVRITNEMYKTLK